METLYGTTGACLTLSRDSIKSSRVAQFRYTAKAVFVARERVFVHHRRVARGPEVKRRKNQVSFLNRLIGGPSFGLVEFSWDLREV